MYGDPLAGGPIRGYAPTVQRGASIEDRFWAKVDIPKDNPLGCWLWTAALNPGAGYGIFQLAPGKREYAHRLAYEWSIGPIDPVLELDHLCRERRCVNPLHLQAVTQHENQRRRPDRRVTHCPQGHPYSGDNLYEWKGHRHCRACQRERRATAA